MPSFASLAQRQAELIRKPLTGFIALAPLSATLPTSITSIVAPATTPTIAPLPTGYAQLGLVDKKTGIKFGRDDAVDDVESWGALEPTRTDTQKDVTSAQFMCQETNLNVLGLYYNTDLSAVVPDATTKEVAFNQLAQPATTYHRFIFIGVDGVGANEIIVAKILPRASVTKYDDQTWTQSQEMGYGMTVTAKYDKTAGYAVRHVFGGAGWANLLAGMGFPTS